ncbi:Ig-like domain-containing protein [Vibrio sp. B1Z05]|uniref:Ig-like domain-containing protein n=1 Tax=Vibrio sp. B1Z05 TaxID=2654980 RepID=UPI00128D1A92|nr:Ig-like domain-containing protein [Vibrio sp. B1Z05]MPW35917.1 Ig-like domain-containing protein [Vibrio sp. B1Z05]
MADLGKSNKVTEVSNNQSKPTRTKKVRRFVLSQSYIARNDANALILPSYHYTATTEHEKGINSEITHHVSPVTAGDESPYVPVETKGHQVVNPTPVTHAAVKTVSDEFEPKHQTENNGSHHYHHTSQFGNQVTPIVAVVGAFNHTYGQHTDTSTPTVTSHTVAGNQDSSGLTPPVVGLPSAGTVVEDTTLVTSGTLDSHSAQKGTSLTFSPDNLHGKYGDFSLNKDTGEWSYKLDNSHHQDLAQGETHTEVLHVTVTSAAGASAHQDITVTVQGTDDAPVITSQAQNAITQEDGKLSAQGQVTATDVDHGAVLTYTPDNTQGHYGSFTIDPNSGEWQYTLDNAHHQDLAEGETHTDSMLVTVTDEKGASTSETVKITVLGTNDAPVINHITSMTTNEGQPIVHGNVIATDIDHGDTVTYGTHYQHAGFTLHNDGSYTIDPADKAFDHLAVGEHETLIIPVVATDNHGGQSQPQNLIIRIDGTNDKPVVSHIASQVVNEGDAAISGQITSTDLDHGDTATYSTTFKHAGFTLDNDGTYHLDPADASFDHLAVGEHATLVIPVIATDNNGGLSQPQNLIIRVDGTNDNPVVTHITSQVVKESDAAISGHITSSDLDHGDSATYSTTFKHAGFTLDNDGTYHLDPTDASFDHLAVGEHETLIVPVIATDKQNGQSQPQNLIIRVDGTNDKPVVTHIASQTVNEGDKAISGQITSSDLDHGDTATYSTTFKHAGFTLDNDGTYHLDPTDASFDHLAVGEHETLIVPVVATDNNKGQSQPQNLIIRVDGTNDKPVVTHITSQTVNEGDAAISGQITSTDKDHGDKAQYSTTFKHDGFSLDIDGTYHLDPTDASFDYLAAGEHETLMVPIVATDKHNGQSLPQNLIIKVMGTNDAPVLTFSESKASHSQGTLDNTDVDINDTHTYAIGDKASANPTDTMQGQFGELVLDTATGKYTYTPAASVAGMTVDSNGVYHGHDVFTVSTIDNHGAISTKYLEFDPQVTVTAPSKDGDPAVLTPSVPTPPQLLDTQPPVATPVTPETNSITGMQLTDATDSGTDHTDGITNIASPVIEGSTHVPFSVVTFTDENGNEVGRTTSDQHGHFNAPLHSLTGSVDGTQYHITGHATAPSSTGAIDTPTPLLVTIDNSIDTPVISPIAPSNDLTPALHGTGEPGSTITFTDGTNTLGQTVVGTDGTFSFTPQTDLHEGSHITATAIDNAGNKSPATTVATNIDTTIAQTTVDMTDGTVGSVGHPNHDIDATEMSSVSISGSIDRTDGTEQLTSLTISDGTHVMTLDPHSVTVNSKTGQFTLSGVDLTGHSFTDGTLTVTAIATDAAGNTSPASATVTLDTSAPIAPTVDAILPGNDLTPTITGTGEVGSTITFTDGTNELGHVVVGSQGTFSFTPSTDLKEGDHITGTSTDKAGNTSPEVKVASNIDTSIQPTTVDMTDGTVGSVDHPNHDIDATEMSSVSISGSIDRTDGTEQLTSLSISDGTHVMTLDPHSVTVNSKTGQFTLSGVDLTGHSFTDGTLTVTAIATDAAGNTSPASATVTLDTSAPTAPTVDAILPGNDLTPTITGTGEVGSTITFTDGTNELGHVVVGSQGTFSFTPSTDLKEGDHITLTSTDKAGNTSPEVKVASNIDTTPGSISFDKNISGDNVLNHVEQGQDLVISGTTTGIENAQVVTVHFNGQDYQSTVTDCKWSVTVDKTELAGFKDGESLSITADVKDAAGNVAQQATHSLEVDNSVNAPTIHFESTGTDSVYNQAEVGADNTITATIDLPADAVVGDTVTIDRTAHVLTATDISAQHITQEVSPGASVTASITDQAGNVSTLTTETAASADVLAGTIAIDSKIAVDDVLNKLEQGQALTISGTTSGIEDDQVVTVHFAGQDYTTQGAGNVHGGAWSVTIPTSALAQLTDAQAVDITADVTDAAGNPAPQATHHLDVDLTVGSPVGHVPTPTSASGEYNAVDVSANGTITATIDLPTDAVAGDTLTIDGTDRVLKQSEIDQQQTSTELKPGTSVSVTLTDQAGNVSAPTQITVAKADTTAGSIAIEDKVSGDDVLNLAEQGKDLVISGTTQDIEDGQVVTVHFAGQDYTTQGAGKVHAGAWSVTIPTSALAQLTDAQAVDITADVTDAAGNPALQATHHLDVDLTVGSPVGHVPTPTSASGEYNAVDVGANGTITATIDLPTDAVAGDTLTIDGTDRVLKQSEIDQQQTSTELKPGASVSVTLTDQAGNVSAPSQITVAKADTTAGSIAIEDKVSGDDVLNHAEQGKDLVISGTTQDIEDGQVVTVHFAGQDYTTQGAGNVHGGAWSVTIPTSALAQLTDAQAVDITADVTDAAGNPAPQATHHLDVDLTVGSPVVHVPTPTSASGEYNAVDVGANGTITATIDLPTDAVAGDTLTIDGTDRVLKQSEIDQQQTSTELKPGTSVSVTLTDQAGNVSAPTQITVAKADTTAGSIAIEDKVSGDDVLNHAEQGKDLVISGTTQDIEDGQVVTVHFAGQDYTTQGAGNVHGGAWSVTIPTSALAQLTDAQAADITADVTDAAGNPALQATHHLDVDLTVGSPVGHVPTPTSASGEYNAVDVGANGTITATIDLPTDAVAGDTLTIDGTDRVLKQSEIDQQQTSTELKPGTSVSVTLTDQAGNVSAPTQITVAKADTTAGSIAIEDKVSGDDVLNHAEQGQDLVISGTTQDIEDGQVVTVHFAGQDYTTQGASNVHAGAWSVTIPTSALAQLTDAQAVDITADVTDAAGNPAAQATHSLLVDTNANAPSIHFEDPGSDGIYNALEVAKGNANTITATIQPDSDAKVGDVLHYTIKGNSPVEHTLTQNDLTDGVTVEVHPGDDVTATVTDAAGNVSSSTSETAPTADTDAGSISITPNVSIDNFISHADLSSDLKISGSTSGIEAGQVVDVEFNNHHYTADVKADHSWTLNVPSADLALLHDGDVQTITANVSDHAGNPATPATHNVDVDIFAGAPSINFSDSGADGIYNAAELNPDGTATATIDLPKDATVGDTLKLSITLGSQATVDGHYALTAQDISAGHVDFEVQPGSKVTASITDNVGNTSNEATATAATADVTLPSAAIHVEALTVDNTINSFESSQDVSVVGHVTGDFKQGDTVTVTIDKQTYTGTLEDKGNFNVKVPGSVLKDHTSFEARIDSSDLSGNKVHATTTHDYSVDTQVGKPSISLESAGSDHTYNIQEVGSEGTVTATIDIPLDAVVGDILTINNAHRMLTATDISTRQVMTEVKPGSTVTASISDKVGNVSELATVQVASENLETPKVTINVDSITSDNIINQIEAGSLADINAGTSTQLITGTVQGDFNSGDIVVIDNIPSATGVVDSSGKFSIPVPTKELLGQTSLQLHMDTQNAAGNPGHGTAVHDYSVDTQVGAPIITFEGQQGNPHIYNANEVGPDGTIKATIMLSPDTTIQDTLTVNGKPVPLTQDIVNLGEVVIEVQPGERVEASVIDNAGNVSAVTTEIAPAADLTPPSVSIHIEEVTTDNIVNSVESQQVTVPITGEVTGEFNSGDTVTVSIGTTSYSGAVDSSGHFSIDVPSNDLIGHTSLEAQITTTDAAGNTGSDTDTHTYTVATDIPIVTLDSIAFGNDPRPAISGHVDVKSPILIPAGTEVEIQIVGDSHTYKVTTDAHGDFVLAKGALQQDLPDGQTDVIATVTDAAGNVGKTSEQVDVDTTAGTIKINSSLAADGFINHIEQGQDLEISGTTTGIENGQDVTVHFNGQDYHGHVTDGKWSAVVDKADLTGLNDGHSLTITADVSDKAGNVAPQASSSINVDLSSSANVIVNPLAAGIINKNTTGDITVTGIVNGDANVGDSIEVEVNGHKHQSSVIDVNGQLGFSVDVPADELKEHQGVHQITATVKGTDIHGNSFTATGSHDFIVDTDIIDTQVSLTDGGNCDGVVNQTEAAQGVRIEGNIDPSATLESLIITDSKGHELDLTSNVAVEKNGHFITHQVVDSSFESGSLSVTATAKDNAGNVSKAVDTSTLDTTIVKTMVSLTDGGNCDGVINHEEAASGIRIEGSIDPSATLESLIVMDSQHRTHDLTAQAHVDTTGHFIITGIHLSPLAQGELLVTAIAKDSVGNVSVDTDTQQVDTIGPTSSVLVDPITTDNILNAVEAGGTVVVSGTVTGGFQDGDTVILTVNSVATQGKVDSTGHFSVDVAGSDLKADTNVVAKVVTTDKAGNKSSYMTTHAYYVDTTLHTPTISLTPTSDTFGQDPASSTTHIGSDSDHITKDVTPTFSITGVDIDAKSVEIFDGNISLGLAQREDHERWSFSTPSGTGLTTQGVHHIRAQVTDNVGNQALSKVYDVTIDTETPKPTLSVHNANNNNASPKLTGTAEAGSIVVIKDGNVELGSVLANKGGHYEYDMSSKAHAHILGEGTHELVAEAIDKAGNTHDSDSVRTTIKPEPKLVYAPIGSNTNITKGDASGIVHSSMSTSKTNDHDIHLIIDGHEVTIDEHREITSQSPGFDVAKIDRDNFKAGDGIVELTDTVGIINDVTGDNFYLYLKGGPHDYNFGETINGNAKQGYILDQGVKLVGSEKVIIHNLHGLKGIIFGTGETYLSSHGAVHQDQMLNHFETYMLNTDTFLHTTSPISGSERVVTLEFTGGTTGGHPVGFKIYNGAGVELKPIDGSHIAISESDLKGLHVQVPVDGIVDLHFEGHLEKGGVQVGDGLTWDFSVQGNHVGTINNIEYVHQSADEPPQDIPEIDLNALADSSSDHHSAGASAYLDQLGIDVQHHAQAHDQPSDIDVVLGHDPAASVDDHGVPVVDHSIQPDHTQHQDHDDPTKHHHHTDTVDWGSSHH